MFSTTATPAEHRPLPQSGELLGLLADALRLKSEVLDVPGANERSVRRWFAGERVTDEIREQVIAVFLDAWLPRRGVDPSTAHPVELLRAVLPRLLRQWDRESGLALQSPVAVTKPSLVTLPLARMFGFDLGLRYGALRRTWDALGGPRLPEALLDTRALPDLLDRLRASADGLSVVRLAEEVGVDATTVERWRSLETLPSNDVLPRLANALAAGGSSEDVLVALRLATACSHVSRGLRELYGEFLFTQIEAAANETAAAVYRRITTKGIAEPHITAIVLDGARSRVGASLCRDLAATIDMNNDVGFDFGALPGDWSERVRRWAMTLHQPPEAEAHAKRAVSDYFRAHGGAIHESIVDAALKAASLHVWLIAGFDERMPADMHTVNVRLPPEIAVSNWIKHATDYADVGDWNNALKCATTAVERAPNQAYPHFILGALMGEFAARNRAHKDARALAQEAIRECRIAWVIDPTQPIALNEVAIILGNVISHEDAEVVFAEAAPHCGHLDHHHFTRAKNLLALERFEDAVPLFERVLELRGDHVEARCHLAVLYERNGARRKANEHAAWARQRTGADPRDRAEDWLDPFFERHSPPPRRS